MKKIDVLDCTLRDGGYCNEWKFGNQNIKKIVQSLVESGIDIIECGFLTDKVEYTEDISRFNRTSQADAVIPEERGDSLFVCMINYGEYDLAQLPPAKETKLDGIRFAFHKKNLKEAVEACRTIKEKGYLLFLQPMVTLNYTDEEFLDLMQKSNELQPYAFYIVDSFGAMKQKQLIRLFYMAEHNLNADTIIGYHAHNNLQLAFSNAQALVEISTKRDLVIDSSVFGMGRGAGNLNTELFVEYLNDNIESIYKLQPLLRIIDEILNQFYQENYWGYSLANYLSATHNIHPNYAGFLEEKNKLTVRNIDEIFAMMDEDKKWEFHKDYIRELYRTYLSKGNIKDENLNALHEQLRAREVLLIAPGKSSQDEAEKIISFVKARDVVTICVNFDYPQIKTDYIFVSNIRRYGELERKDFERLIVTSNIKAEGAVYQTEYTGLMNEFDCVSDNAGMLLIKFLIQNGVKKIWLAGIDGYSYNMQNNYTSEKMKIPMKLDMVDAMNHGLEQALDKFSKEVEMEFLTGQQFVRMKNHAE